MSLDPKIFDLLKHFGRTKPLCEIASADGTGEDQSNWIALRHDIDHDLDLALELAHHEHAMGIRATYFLLHTAPYWNDPDFILKCQQLKSYGHEVGLHFDIVTELADRSPDSVDGRLGQVLARLGGAVGPVVGIAGHGAKACYEFQCTNYWFWKELRPTNPMETEHLRSAEGPMLDDPKWQIPYPAGHRVKIHERDVDLWSVSMRGHGLDYEASALACDRYWTDTGGSWARSPNPMDHDLSTGRHMVMMHPIWWRGSTKTHFVLGADPQIRSNLASMIDRCTPATVFDEWTLTHTRVGTSVERSQEPLQPTAIRIKNALAHHNKLVAGDVVEFSTLLGPTRKEVFVDDGANDAQCCVWKIESPRRRLVQSALDLLQEHRSLYQHPEDPPLWDMDGRFWRSWAWMSREQRLQAHIQAAQSNGCDDREWTIPMNERSSRRSLLALADTLGLVVHPLMFEAWKQSNRGRLGKHSENTSSLYSGRTLWDDARCLTLLDGDQTRRRLETRWATATSDDASGSEQLTISWHSGQSSAPQAVIHIDLPETASSACPACVLGQIQIAELHGDLVRFFLQCFDAEGGLITRTALSDPGQPSLCGSESMNMFRFSRSIPAECQRVGLEILASKESFTGSIQIDSVEFRLSAVNLYK